MINRPVLLLALQRNNAIEHAHDIYKRYAIIHVHDRSLDPTEKKSILYSYHQEVAHCQIALSFNELNSEHFRVKTILK
jgi:hypothetical protein